MRLVKICGRGLAWHSPTVNHLRTHQTSYITSLKTGLSLYVELIAMIQESVTTAKN